MDRTYKRLVLLGTKTDHGGCVISVSSTFKTGGGRVALDGDLASCPQKGHGGVVQIISKRSSKNRDRSIAITGDVTTCGAVLIDGAGSARVAE
jgi:uncharacterized Zn-binding protein involved in type VI secretion